MIFDLNVFLEFLLSILFPISYNISGLSAFFAMFTLVKASIFTLYL